MAVFRTNSRAAIVVVALIGLFLLQNPALEAHTFTADSTISIRFKDGKFRGKVKSPRERCIYKRRVSVYKVRSDRPDLLIGRDRSDKRGRYVVPKPDGVEGNFFARVTPRKRGHYQDQVHRCRGAISRIIRVP